MLGILLALLTWAFGGQGAPAANPAVSSASATVAPTAPSDDEIRRRCPTCVKN